MLYAYPKQAHFGKVVAKSKFYQHGNLSTVVKEKFVAQIEKIVWRYKLSAETINLAATVAVPEIEIFDIRLKGDAISDDLLRAMDRAIPFPIIYQIHRGDAVKVKAAYKRPSDADKTKWVTEAYVESDWLDAATDRTPLPVALDLEKLYEQILQSLMPRSLSGAPRQRPMREQMALLGQIKAKEHAYAQLKAKRDKEKQFNKKVKINQELHKLKVELERLKYANQEENA